MKKIKMFIHDILHPYDWTIVYMIRSALWKLKDYDRLEHDYCCVLCHATSSNMSKPNYELQTIYTVIDQAQELIHYSIVKDDINDIFRDDSLTPIGQVNEIKKYLKTLPSI